jgi:hypothetical protein
MKLYIEIAIMKRAGVCIIVAKNNDLLFLYDRNMIRYIFLIDNQIICRLLQRQKISIPLNHLNHIMYLFLFFQF